VILKMGTRGSALALAQSGWVARELSRLNPGLSVETVKITTSGDRFSIESPQAAKKLMPEGTKGLFVKEIEEALLGGAVDFAVHSGKDLPAALAAGLEIAAYPRREDCRDVYIGREGVPWSKLGPGHRVGTSSLRRGVQLLAAKPGVCVIALRGNVDTRLRKLKEGACDGIIIALAGLRRLGRADVPHEPIPTEVMLPAPAQGALAVEARSDRRDVISVLARLDHEATRREAECERAFLAEIGGGCSTPLGALACWREGLLSMAVFWSDPEGRRPVRLEEACPTGVGAPDFSRGLARRVLAL
jgi:hydroxymethylbilane synthase